MTLRRLVALCVAVLLSASRASAASAGFPNFPTADDDRLVLGAGFGPVSDDIADDEPAAPAAPLQITHMRVRSEIALRYARTAVICNVYNPSKRAQESAFNVLLPETAFISGFTMSLGKETYDAYVKEKEEAKQIYNDAVAQGVSAAHVATKARDSNHFTIKFNVEGRSNATYRLRYEEFLVRRNGVYNHAINLHPGALVPKMDVVVHIKESQKISVLRVPELRTGNEVDATDEDAQNTNAVILRGRNQREATVTFTPDLMEQTRLAEIYAKKTLQSGDEYTSHIGYDDSAEDDTKTEGLLGQFVVQYDVEQPKDGEILVNDGYFVHLFAPRELPPLSKHVVFALDTSGSMYGTKQTQLQSAMNAILDDLRPTDYFHIIEFNEIVTVRDLKDAKESAPRRNADGPVPPALATPENIALAKTIVSKFDSNGGTDISTALHTALKVIEDGNYLGTPSDSTNTSLVEYNNGTDQNKNELEPMIIFLTDGDPTVGEQDLERIIKSISERNSGEKRTPIYSLAFGDDADRVFLRKLSLRNEGFMRHIYEAADAALQLRDFYRQVSSPLLADVKFLYPSRQIKEDSVSRSQFRTVNDGAELAVVGRVAEGVKELTPRVLALRAEREGRGRKVYETSPTVVVTRGNDSYLPLERLWAYLTIKQLLDKRDAGDGDQSGSGEDKPEKKALAIALKYSFVTPLTSLVVVRLNKTDVEDLVDAEAVDHPKFLPYSRRHVQSLTHEKLSYSASASGDGLSISSSAGPVLFVQSSNRLTSTGVAYGGYGHSIASGGGSSYYSSHGDSSGPLIFSGGTLNYQSHHFGGSGYGARPSSGYGSHGHHHFGSSHGYGGYKVPPSHSGTSQTQNSQSNQFSASSSCDGSKGTLCSSTTTTTSTAKPTYDDPTIVMYHLQGFEWTLWHINTTADALQFPVNGGVSLKLSRDPSQKLGDDYDCWPEVPGQEGFFRKMETCVYITRCRAARSPYGLPAYLDDMCYVGDEGYAGVCCPPDQIDEA